MEGPCLQGEGKDRESGKGNLAVLSFTLQLCFQFSSPPPGKGQPGGREGKKEMGLEREREKSLVSLEGGGGRVERGGERNEGRAG